MCGRLNARGIHFAVVQAEKTCDGCRRCADICPDAAIEMDLLEEAHEKAPARHVAPGATGGAARAPRHGAVMAK
jgi:ferredoxin